MHFKDMVDDVADTIQDPKLSGNRIKTLLNEAYETALRGTTDPLPDLEATATVVTVLDQAYTELPTDYLRDLNWVYDQTRDRRITLLGGLQLLKIKFPGLADSGNVEYAAVSGSNLYYQKIPSTRHTLSLNYYRKPVMMASDRDEPDMLPSHLHRRLLVNYACKVLFSPIEDGLAGPKRNTMYHDEEYRKAFAELTQWIIPRSSEPIEINDTVTEYLE